MRNRTYGGVRGRKTKVGEKLLRFPPTRLLLSKGYFFKVIQPTEARFCASEILAYTSVVATFL